MPALSALAPVLLVIVSLALWLSSLREVDLRDMNDLGLASVLPWTSFAALGILTVGFCLVLRAEMLRLYLVLLHIGVVIFMLYGIPSVLQEAPRTPIAYKLVGVADYISSTGTADPTIDAFFNWSGFFILTAFVKEVLGLPSALELAHWAPVIFNVLYLAPLVMLLSTATHDRRIVWLGVWLFYLANWIGQDYLAPQALNYLLYLCLLALLLTWFKTPAAQSSPWRERLPLLKEVSWFERLRWQVSTRIAQSDLSNRPTRPRERIYLLGLCILIFAFMVPSHQLTPFAALGSVTGLVLFRRILPVGLPILMVVMLGAWISFMAVPYLAGHIHDVIAPLGAVTSNVQASFLQRYRGSPEHIFILNLRVALSLFVWLLALGGFLRRFRDGYFDFNFVLLALIPFGLLPLQRYGGELLLRVYLYSLPFMVWFAATLFISSPLRRASPKRMTAVSRPLLIGATSLVLCAGFLFARYGNERMDYFTPNEVAAVQELYKIAPQGSLLLAGTGHVPWRYREYNSYRYQTVETRVRDANAVDLAKLMSNNSIPGAYLILTRSQQASAELFIGWDPGTWERFEVAVEKSGAFETVYENGDARILKLGTRGTR
jgi:hypothetical protein